MKYCTYIIVWDDGIGCNSLEDHEKLELLESDEVGGEWWQGILSNNGCPECSLTQDGYSIDGFDVAEKDDKNFHKALIDLSQKYKFRIFKEFSL